MKPSLFKPPAKPLVKPQEIGALSNKCLNFLAPLARSKHYHDGEFIHQRGERKPGLSVVVAGAVSVGNYGIDGRYIQTTVLRPGESFGEFTLFSQLPRTHTAEAVGTSQVDHIGASVLKQAIRQEPELALELLTSLSTRLHRMLETVDDIQRLPMPVRLAKLLYSWTYEENQGFWVRHSQEQLAQRLGSSRMTISAALKHLEQDGLIQRYYQRIEILAPTKLARWLELHTQTLPLSQHGLNPSN